jgi:hypothetical protein
MLSIRYIILLGLLFLGPSAMYIKQADKPSENRPEQGGTSLPFTLTNKVIILPVQINGSDSLQFIFGTGLDNSIICELDTDEVIDLRDAREVQVRGMGRNKPFDAIQSTGNSLRVGDLIIPDQDYLIFKRNILQLTRKMGTKIHGMLNAQAFSAYIVEIDYERKQLIVYQPGYFRKHKNLDGYATLQMEMIGGAPFVMATVLPEKNTSYPVRLMLDTGAGNALILKAGTLPGYTLPEASKVGYLGYGINGNIKGRVGRIWSVDLGPFHLHDVPVSYPDPQAYRPEETFPGQNGSLGSEFLRRFNMILDFPGKKVHIKPNSAFEDRFQYDMSGLEILVPIPDEHRYIIGHVLDVSGAASAGIRPGDEIVSINGIPCTGLSLDEMYKRLHGKNGTKIRMVLLREDKRFRASFRLEQYP